ncbi:MAG: EamA family transporter [Actinobacteria bacterium]|nr:EamA family transporter [Actinomycetota bacterium]
MAARYGSRIWLALGVVYLAWGSTFVALAVVVRDLPPFLAMSARHLIAGGLLLAYALPRGAREGDPVGRRQIGAAFIFGGLLFLMSHGSLAWGQQTIPAGVAALLVGSIPIWMALLDRIVFGRRLPVSAYVGFLLGFAGLAFLFDPFGGGSIDRIGALVIVGGALTWATGSLYSRGAPLPRRPIVAAGLGSVCGGLLLAMVSVASGELGDARVSADAVLGLAYLIVVGSFAGFTAYVWLLRAAPLSLISTYAYVNPVVAVILGWAVLGEEITVRMLVAGAAIVVSVALIVRASARPVESGRGLLRREAVSAAAAERS